MNLSKILAAIRQEREQIDAVIHLLENPIGHRPPRRPPKTNRAGAFLRVEERLADAVFSQPKTPGRYGPDDR